LARAFISKKSWRVVVVHGSISANLTTCDTRRAAFYKRIRNLISFYIDGGFQFSGAPQ